MLSTMFPRAVLLLGQMFYKAIGWRPTFSHRLSHLFSAFMPEDLQLIDKNGFFMYLNLRHPGDLVRAWGAWEIGLHRYLSANLSRGMTFVDIGAHHGTYTLLAASIVGSRGRVFAFEPDPDSASIIRKSIAANEYKNVQIFETVAGEKPEVRNLRSVNPQVSYANPEDVAVERVDAQIDTVVDFIKIDVDGNEGEVIQGLMGIVGERTRVIVEASDFSYQTINESLDLILSKDVIEGFNVSAIKSDGTTVPFIRDAFHEKEVHLVLSRRPSN